MEDQQKTKAQLIDELNQLRGQVAAGAENKEAGAAAEPRLELKKQARRRLRDEVWQMRQVGDIEQVLAAIGAALEAGEISFLAYSVNVVEEPEGSLPILVYLHGPQGEQIRARLARDQVETQIILEAWGSKQVLYRPDLVRENRYGEHLAPQPPHHTVRSAIDVPFSCGTLALASARSGAFSETDIVFLQEICEVLEGGFRRLEDLLALQRALRREEALGRVRDRIIAMRHQDELGGELETAWIEELRGLGIPVNVVSVQRPVEGGRFYSQTFFSSHARSWADNPHGADNAPKTEAFPWLEEAWESGNPVVVDRARMDQVGFSPTVQSLLEVPLPGGGSIGVNSLHPDAFGPEVVRTVQLFVGLIAEGLLRLRDFAALEEGERRYRGLSEQLELELNERKRLEQDLIRTQRLRAVGELSAGLCHNLNNLLTGVLVPAEMLQLASGDAKINRLADTIVEAGTRAADLVHRLHRSVRGGSAEPLAPVDLNETITGVVQMARPRWKDEPEAKGLAIAVNPVLAPVPLVRATLSELYDLLVNLLLNAVDAMPQGGTITITTASEGEMVRLDFTDTGIGMDEATRLRVFEPFFTTKANLGTGLGLSTLYRSVHHWGGAVAVESSPGAGTTFTLRLPIWVERVRDAVDLEPGVVARPGRVLVIDDDQTIGAVLAEALSAEHQVAVFTDGHEALAQFRPGQYEVAILDLGMPGITGDQVARRIGELDPAVARVLFSGWVLEAGDPRRAVFDLALQKPLRDLRALGRAMAQAIALCDRRRCG